MKDADLTDVFAKLDAIQRANTRKREENRALAESIFPGFGKMWEGMVSVGFAPKLVKLEKF